MSLPDQLIPEGKKDDKWCIANINAIVKMAGIQYFTHSKDKQCYDMYFGYQKESDFEYLTGTENYRMPARVRFMPMTRPLFDILRSTVESRPIEPFVYAVDNDSLDDKKDQMVRKFMDKYVGILNARQERVSMLQLQLQTAKARSQPQDGQPPDADTSAALQQMNIAMAGIESAVARSEDVLQNETSKMEREYRYSFQTQQEKRMTTGLKYMFTKYGLRDMFCDGFTDLMVVDNEIYRVEDVWEGKDPKLRKVNTLYFYYAAEIDANFVDECEWNMEDRYMTISSIMDEFGDQISDEDSRKLKDRYPAFGPGQSYNQFGFNSMPLGDLNDCSPNTNVYSGSIVFQNNMVRVSSVCWRSPRKVMAKQSASKYGDDITYTHLVKDEKVGADETLLIRYTTDWWEGTRIGSDVFVNMRRCPFQYRDIANIGRSYGPYIGYAYNGMDKRPYSRVLAVKDIQILYNLVYYQMELLIALSGIKGFIMDRSQKPDGMKDEEWIYYLKQGIAWVDSSQTGPNGRTSTFNQFSTYDLTFGNGIQQCQELLGKLEYLAGRVIGIPPQRLGEVLPQDQVNTHAAAIAQSNLTTETLFHKHDRIVKRAGDRLLHACVHAWKNGKRGHYIGGDLGQYSFNISARELDDCRYEMFFGDPGREQNKLDRALQLMQADYENRGATTLTQLISGFNANNLKELEETLTHYEGIAMKRGADNAQSQMDHEKELEQVRANSAAMVKKQLTDGESLKGKIDQAQLQLEQSRIQIDNNTKLQQEGMRTKNQKDIADQNTGVEYAVLDEQRREHDIDARLKQMEIAMSAIKEQSQRISSTPSKNKPSDR